MKNELSIYKQISTNAQTDLKRFVVRLDGYGTKIMLAESLAHVLRDIQHLTIAGLSVTIVCEDKRGNK